MKFSLKLSNVSYGYGGRSHILNKINLLVNSNNKIGIVGESGVGKTTLAKIMYGLISNYEGNVWLNDIDITKLKLSQIRKFVGYIPQKSFVFNMSIKDNLLMGIDRQVDIEELIDICIQMDLHKDIEKMPDKYETILAENGYSLSGGQQQKICIIQSLLRKPQFLIMDEATSSLDSFSEEKVNQVIKKLNIPIVIISHRLTSVAGCNQILVLKNGTFCESGSHEELIKYDGFYASLWMQQMLSK